MLTRGEAGTMPRRPRSLKQEMDQWSAQLRTEGNTWVEVAEKFRPRWNLNARQAFREAHRYTQLRVTEIWNSLWPDEPLTVRKLGSWEAWPDRGGHEPSICTLNRLAKIYECRTQDLVDGEDHRPDTETTVDRHGTVATDNLDIGDVCGVLSALPALQAADGISLGSLRDQEYDALVHALAMWAARIKRRDVLALIGAAATAAAASPLLTMLNEIELNRIALVAENPSRIDAATVGHVEMLLHHCMRQEDTLGPKAVLETVLAPGPRR